MSLSVLITEHDFNIASEYKALCDSAPHSGAVVFFVGLVRDLYKQDASCDEKVSHIELEHYPGMTEQLCQQIMSEAQTRFGFSSARLVHRVGSLHAGDQIVFVAVASQHRESAFEAAQFIMDYLKTRATFWKKEVGDQGSHWLGIKDKDKKAAKRWAD